MYAEEIVIPADSDELAAFPFLFMTGHKLVRFTTAEREPRAASSMAAACCSRTTAITTSTGSYAKSFEDEMRRTFPGAETLAKIPNAHAIYRSFFRFPGRSAADQPRAQRLGRRHGPRLSAGRRARRGRLGVIYSNKDYGCEWDYDWRNKRFQREDNTRFAVNLVVYAMTS